MVYDVIGSIFMFFEEVASLVVYIYTLMFGLQWINSKMMEKVLMTT